MQNILYMMPPWKTIWENNRADVAEEACTTQRKSETQAEYVLRSPHIAENAAGALGYSHWVTHFLINKWRLAGRVLRATDSGRSR